MAFNANTANALTVVLTNLNMTLAVGGGEKKAMNYPSFSERDNEDINDFIIELEKAFVINRIVNGKKHLVIISCLKGIAANFYNRLVEITNWNTARQVVNIQLRLALIVKFESEVQTTHYYN